MKRGKELLESFRDPDHRKSRCHGCSKDVTRTALVDLVYTFEKCSCELSKHEHLVETLWHRACFVTTAGKPEVQK